MKKITILSLFPEFYESFLNTSIIKRAISKKLIKIEIINYRDFTLDKHHRVDSAPIGGGAGLILKCQPIVDALKSIKEPTYKILLSPKGNLYNQKKANELLKHEHIVLIAGHYEGHDERLLNYIDEEISLGDYILTGGEIPSLAIADSLIRLIDGSINKESLIDESFNNDLLEYPQYTEPYNFDGYQVPDILYSGNHQAIQKYRLKEALKLTKEKRPDLFKEHTYTKEEKKLLKEIENQDEEPKWYKDALTKGKRFLK